MTGFWTLQSLCLAQRGYGPLNESDHLTIQTDLLSAPYANGQYTLEPKTYYVREASKFGDAAGFTNVNNRKFVVANGGRIRVVGGIGVGSLRWKKVLEHPGDPYYARLSTA